MSTTRVPKALRARVAEQAGQRCGYCLSSETITGIALEIDHLLPEALGGETTEDNLWLACSACNDAKGDRVTARDPLTGEWATLFNPRTQRWHDHFTWTDGGARIEGLTPTGRATVLALQLNRALLVGARRAWVLAGWHPPADTEEAK
jgi:hypothetical protein